MLTYISPYTDGDPTDARAAEETAEGEQAAAVGGEQINPIILGEDLKEDHPVLKAGSPRKRLGQTVGGCDFARNNASSTRMLHTGHFKCLECG